MTILPSVPEFRRGELNGDGSFDISDAVYLLAALFSSGPPSNCSDAADANDDGAIDIADAILILNALFGTMATIPAPGILDCGPDPTSDGLDCGMAICP